ncbi:MAG TPA: hypothetical protein VFW03_06905, partial [Gemmatimonadaceae bacterium]|nr:hypothetical protein [Gemmatimonadaceae bacterium]
EWFGVEVDRDGSSRRSNFTDGSILVTVRDRFEDAFAKVYDAFADVDRLLLQRAEMGVFQNPVGSGHQNLSLYLGCRLDRHLEKPREFSL